MFRTPSKTDQAKDAVAGAEKVTTRRRADKAAELKVKAGEAARATAAGAAVAKVKAAEAAEVARETAETVKEYAHEAAETLAPKVEHARDTFVEDVLPKVASALADDRRRSRRREGVGRRGRRAGARRLRRAQG